MEKQYHINGMSCNGCREKIEKSLNEIPNAEAHVSLDPPLATIKSAHEIPMETLQQTVESAGNYQISDHAHSHEHKAETKAPAISASGKYICPMHCEGDKTYDEPGNCPVCGMFLVPIEDLAKKESEPKKGSLPTIGSLKKQKESYETKTSCCSNAHEEKATPSQKISPSGKYACPMFCEGDKVYDEPGRCPVCNMFLVPVEDLPKKEDSAASCCGGSHDHEKPKATASSAGKYYCPMHCEGDKLYDHAGSCPVCGMNLEKIPDFNRKTEYTCPMHPDITSDEPGACPICGMDLVPIIPSDEEDHTYFDLRKKFWISVALTLPVFILSMGEMIPGDPIGKIISPQISGWIQLALSIPVVFYCGWMFFQRAWTSFKTWKLNMFSLIGLGSGAAFIYSIVGLLFPDIFPAEFRGHHGHVSLYFESVCVILTLVLLGQLMEAKAHSKTNSAIKELIKLTPTEATLVENGVDKKIAVDKIVLGNHLRVKPGEKVPVDGKIIEGNSTIDESMITGESVPVAKVEGDQVTSGTINGNRSFVMVAERVGSETLLSQIIQMVNDASRSKAPIQKLTDKVSSIFVPVVIAISIITFMLWLILGPDPKLTYAFGNLLAVLIVACPCALGLATPMSVMVGVGKGAKNGILIKNAEALEKLNKVNVLVTDKTGTLTEGKPSVNEFISTSSVNAEKVLSIAASLNQNSTHPLAEAICDKAKALNIAPQAVTDFENITGKGVSGKIENENYILGNQNLMESHNLSIPSAILEQVKAFQKQAKTVSYVANENEVLGFITISDKIKESAKTSIEKLHAMNVDVIMITGDNPETAAAVAEQLGIKKFVAQALPENKLEAIKKLQSEGKIVAMAGDGINDAPALAQANVGIAMGTGTDVAIESSEVTLLKGDLTGIVKAINLSHKLVKNIKQNLLFAFLYNVIGIPIAAGILYPAFGILMSPMIAAAAMSFSSVSVIVNSLRLNSAKI